MPKTDQELLAEFDAAAPAKTDQELLAEFEAAQPAKTDQELLAEFDTKAADAAHEERVSKSRDIRTGIMDVVQPPLPAVTEGNDTIDQLTSRIAAGAVRGVGALGGGIQAAYLQDLGPGRTVQQYKRDFASGTEAAGEAVSGLDAAVSWTADPKMTAKVADWADKAGYPSLKQYPRGAAVSYAAMQAMKAVGDYTTVGRLQNRVQQDWDAFHALDGEAKTKAVLHNLVLNTPETFGLDIADIALTGSAGKAASKSLGTAVKAGRKVLSPVEAAVNNVIRAEGTQTAYKALIDMHKPVMAAKKYIKAERLSKMMPDSVGSPELGLDQAVLQSDLFDYQTILSTPNKPSASARLLAKAEMALGYPIQKGVDAVSWVRDSVVRDPLKNILDPQLARGANLQRMAPNIGRGMAPLHATDMDTAVFGPDFVYNTAHEVQQNLGYIQSLAGADSPLLNSRIKELMDKYKMTRPEAAEAVKAAIGDVTHANPYMKSVYDTAGKFMYDVESSHPQFVDMLNDLSTANLAKIDQNLVNLVEKTGGMNKELMAESLRKGRSDVNAWSKARFDAWTEAWSTHKSSIQEYLTARYPDSSPEFVQHIMNALEYHGNTSRSVWEPAKMANNVAPLPGFYYHQMSAQSPIGGVARETSMLNRFRAGHSRERTGSLAKRQAEALEAGVDDVMNLNLRDVFEKDVADTITATKFREGEQLVLDSGAWSSLKKGEKVGAKGEILDAAGTPTGRVLLDIDGVSLDIIRRLPVIRDAGFKNSLSQGLRDLLDNNRGGKIVDADDVGQPRQIMLTPDQVKEMQVKVGERKITVSSEYSDYLKAITVGRETVNNILNTKASQAIRSVNGPLKTIQVGMDIAGSGMRFMQQPLIVIHEGLRGFIASKRATTRVMDKRQVALYEKMLEEGSIYGGRRGVAELRAGDAPTLVQKLGVMSRHIAYNDRMMYGTDFANMGYDMRSRLALRQVIEDRFDGHMDALHSDTVTKKMAGSMQTFMQDVFEVDTRKLFNSKGATPELEMANRISRVFGDYNAAARTPFQRFAAEHFFNFYGWWRGSFPGIVTAPINHPIRAIAYPLIAADMMNRSFSGQHMWDNEPGKRASIRVDPKQVPWIKFATDQPFYVELPGTLRRMYNVAGLDDFVDAGHMAANGQAKQGAALVLNHLFGGGMAKKVLEYSGPLPLALDRKTTLQGYQAQATTRVGLDLINLMTAKESRQWNEMQDMAAKTAIRQLSFNGEGLYDSLQAQGPWGAPAFMWAANTFGPVAFTKAGKNPYSNRAREILLQIEGAQLPPNLLAGATREDAIMSAGEQTSGGERMQTREAYDTALDRLTKDPKMRRQIGAKSR